MYKSPVPTPKTPVPPSPKPKWLFVHCRTSPCISPRSPPLKPQSPSPKPKWLCFEVYTVDFRRKWLLLIGGSDLGTHWDWIYGFHWKSSRHRASPRAHWNARQHQPKHHLLRANGLGLVWSKSTNRLQLPASSKWPFDSQNGGRIFSPEKFTCGSRRGHFEEPGDYKLITTNTPYNIHENSWKRT